MEELIEWLENKIESCDELGNSMNREKWAFQQCLKKVRLKQLELTAVSQSSELQAVEDLKDWCYDTCNASNRDRLYEILDRL